MRVFGRVRGFALGGLLLAAGCAGIAGQPQEPAGSRQGVPKQLQARQIIVTLAPATPERWASLTQALAAEYQLHQVGAFPLTSIGVQCLVYQVPESRSLAAVVAQLAADPRVESAQPNQVFEGLGAIHTDPYASLVHGARAIRADVAHRLSTGRGVTVAVVDTGVDQDHPDLRGRIVQTANFVEGGERSFAEDRHGTAVAGVIAARADDGIGVFGIAPGAELLAVKACWYPDPEAAQARCSSWTLAKAVDFVINAGARVLNMSLTGPADPLLARLLAAAHGQGIAIVAAAEEQGSEAGFPAALEPVIAVVASDVHGQVPVPTWAAVKPPLAAPGMEILTTAPHGGYDFLSGSSLAAAHVTGVVALLLEQSPDLAPAEIYGVLRDTAGRAPAQAAAAALPAVGLVNACAALTRLMGMPACS